jgi:hypothetical protein
MSYWSRTTLSRDDGGGGELVVAEDDIFETLGCLVKWGKYEQNRFLLKLRDVKANKQTI